MENVKSIKTKKKILAPVGIVWEVLLDPLFTQKWAAAFCEGTWVEAEWKKGGLVVWKDREANISAKGIVRAIERNQLIQVAYFDEVHIDDVSVPTGKYTETYTLSSIEGKTLLAIEAGPLSEEEVRDHEPLWEKALENLKSLAEADYSSGIIN